MKEDFEEIRAQIYIEDIARHLLGEPVRGMFRFPGEKTPSIKIYPNTNSFFDFGRGIGGDAVKLWVHVRCCDSWTALREIKALCGITEMPDRENIRERIQQQEKELEAAERKKREQQSAWRNEVDFWKKVSDDFEHLIQKSEPLSDGWCLGINKKQIAEYRLDLLCGIYK